LIGYMDKGHSRFCGFVLAVICCAAFMIRSWGIEWPSLHPDEYKIASWVEFRKDHGHIQERFYAEGFFTLAKPVYAVHLWLLEQEFQWRCFIGGKDDRPVFKRQSMLFARKFNVWLAVINVALLYFLLVAITGSRVAGLFGAAWLAVMPLHVEHSHYAETDIAAMFMLTLSLWLWTKALMKGGAFRFGLATVVTGFTIGTKFTLTPLLICALAMAWMRRVDEKAWPGTLKCLTRTAVVLLLSLAGLVLANPGILDWSWFYPQVQRALDSVYGETTVLMGGVADKWMPVLVNWKEFRLDAWPLGLPLIGLVVLGIASSFRQPVRRFWPVTLVFPVIFFVYFVFLAPWVRGQEFMLFSASFAVWAGLGLVYLSGLAAENISRSNLVRGAGFVVALWALAATAIAGIRTGGLFAWPDPRVVAKEWIGVHAPADRVTGFSPYTDPAFRQTIGKFVYVDNAERSSVLDMRGKGVSYILRNPDVHGRGTINPLTDVRFPQYDRFWSEFTSASRRLWRWETVSSERSCFGYAPMECWGLLHAVPAVSANVPFFRPDVMMPSRDESMWSLPVSLGSVKMVEVTRRPRNMVVYGPALSPDRPVYILIQTMERKAVVNVKGMGCSRRVEMPPYGLEVVKLERQCVRPRLSPYDVINISAEPEKYVLGIPCYAEVLTDESELMCRLVQKGRPEKVADFVKADPVSGLIDRSLWPVFCAATATGDWELAGKLRGRAEALLDKLREASTNLPEKTEFCGLSGIYYDDHSRIRLNDVVTEMARDRTADPLEKNDIFSSLNLPVRVAPGDYQLTFCATMPAADTIASTVPVTIRIMGDELREFELSRRSASLVTMSFHVERESGLCLVFSSPCAGRIVLQDVELRWRLGSMLASVDRELCRALSRYDQRRMGAGSLAAITERAVRYPEDLEMMRLKLQALKLSGKRDTAEWTGLAGSIRMLAPDYALDPAGETSLNYDFVPFFRLTGLQHDKAHGAIRCRFVVLGDNVPTPCVVVSEFMLWPRRWKKVSECELSGRGLLFKGEELVVELPLPAGGLSFEKIALSLRTNTQWVPADYPVRDRKESKIPLQAILGRP